MSDERDAQSHGAKTCEHQFSLVSGLCLNCGKPHPLLGPVKPDHWLAVSA